jgi:hypothetical protein
VVASFEARDWQPDELSECLARADLIVAERWGSFGRDPWSLRTSQQLIVVASRAW